MQISSRFTIAIHVLALIMNFGESEKVTSDFIASSVNVNPVIIRRILIQLTKAGIITVKRGSGGSSIAKPLDKITLLDVYNATDCVEGSLFHFHESPNPLCPVGRNIHNILDEHLVAVQSAMEKELASVTLEDLKKDMKRYIK